VGGARGDNIRPAAVAGRFYPADPQRLADDVARHLASVPGPTGVAPKALIAPHAGYMYSGAVAAAAFAALRGGWGRPIARVVVIGPAHYVAVRGIALPSAAAFATPLGAVPVDRTACAALAALPYVAENDAAHAPEHALEVELPFLQTLLARFALVPLLVGRAAPQHVAEVLARLWGGAETLVVISSDLSHYRPYATACRLDEATAERIERGDWAGIGDGDACGCLPIAGLLIEAAKHGLKARRLALCNSGDTAGPRDQVVGYGAWAFS
jgi:AmmeMemoRadiSam system protein B